MKSRSEEEPSEKPDLIKDEVRFNEDLDKMTDSDSLKNLLQLFMISKDFDLDTMILDIIFQSFSQRSTLVRSLRDVNVVFSNKEIAIFEYCATKIRELSFQIDQSEIWLLGTKKNEKVIDSVNETLQNLVNCFYSSTRVDKITNKLIDIPEQLSDNLISHTRQQLMHSIELHKVLMNLVKDGTYILENFGGDSRKISEVSLKSITLFKSCYLLLALMCRNNYKKAKKSLSKFISIFSMHLPLTQVGQAELICEIYKESDFSASVSESLIQMFFDNILKKGRNPSYLQIFETILQETNQEILQDNISKILTILNDNDKRYRFLFMEFSDKRKQFEFSLRLDNRKEGDIPFMYHIKILDIMIMMLEKSNNPVLIKLIIQKLIPLNAILRVMSKKDCFSPNDGKKPKKEKAYLSSLLKKPMTKFFIKFWLDSDKFNPHFVRNKQLLKFIENETRKLVSVQPKLVSQMLTRKKALQVKARTEYHAAINNQLYKIESVEENMFIEGGSVNDLSSAKCRIVVDTSEIARFAYDYLTYTLVYILPIMTRLNKVFTSPENENLVDRKVDQDCLQGYADSFRDNFFKLKKISMQAYEFKTNVDTLLDVFKIDEDNLKQVVQEDGDIDDISAFEIDEVQQVRSTVLRKYQSNTFSPSDAMRLDSCIMNHMYIDEKDDESRQKLWKSFVLNMSLNENVRKLIKQERNALLKTLMNIDTMEFKKNKNQVITFEKFIRKIIFHIQTCTENLQDIDSHKESLNGSIMLLADFLDSCETEAELVQMQSLLYRCQAVRIACHVFLKPEVPRETQKIMIYFSTKILDGGNTEVQMGFYNIFKSDPDSENFFYMMYNLLTSEIARNGKKLSPAQKAENCVHNWDYVDQQFHFKLPMILRLMQLFAENHNSDLQAYFREQTNSKNNYNMISLLVRLGETLATNVTEEKYLLLLQCMDTLTEFIQGPCYENQVALANSQFIEMASNMLQVSVKEKDSMRKSRDANTGIKLSKRGNTSLFGAAQSAQSELTSSIEEAVTRYYADISPLVGAKIKMNFEKNDPLCVRSWMLHRIKFKTLITLESLLEGRRDQSILKKMIRALPILTLKENLCVLYKNFIAVYGNEKYTSECLNHNDLDPDDPKTDKKKLEMIIQVGFSIYKIMRLYLDYDPQLDDDEATVLALEELRDEINQILRSYAENSMLVERIGSKISELTAATIIKSKKKKKAQPEDYLLRKYFKDALMFFHRHTAHIDILREDHLFTTYFMILPHCKLINQQLQDDFHKRINRSSVKSKISSLLEKSNDIIEVLKYEERIQAFLQSNLISRLLTFKIRWYKDVSLIVCFIQNLLVMLSNVLYIDYNNPNPPSPSLCPELGRTFINSTGIIFSDENPADLRCWCSTDPETLKNCQPSGIIITMRDMGIIQSVVSFMIFLFFFMKTAPILWGRSQKRFKDSETHHTAGVLGVCKRVWRNIFKIIYGIAAIFKDSTLFYYLLYTLCAILGVIFVNDPELYWLSNFFVLFLMFDLVFRAPLLQHIVSAIWRPRISIILALVLYFLCEYVFALVAYYSFPQDYRGQCNTLLTCLSVTTDNTFKANGGIGGYLEILDGNPNYQMDPGSYSMDTARFVFDNLFNFIVCILVVQIISGIIVDTFAVLREEDEVRENDMVNSCFICGFDRQTLDKKSGNRKGFAYHVKFDHNLWNYLNYIAYIKNKEKTEYTGMESYIAEQIQNGEIDWFPIHRSNTSQEVEEEDNGSQITADIGNNVDSLKAQVIT